MTIPDGWRWKGLLRSEIGVVADECEAEGAIDSARLSLVVGVAGGVGVIARRSAPVSPDAAMSDMLAMLGGLMGPRVLFGMVVWPSADRGLRLAAMDSEGVAMGGDVLDIVASLSIEASLELALLSEMAGGSEGGWAPRVDSPKGPGVVIDG